MVVIFIIIDTSITLPLLEPFLSLLFVYLVPLFTAIVLWHYSPSPHVAAVPPLLIAVASRIALCPKGLF